MAVLERVMRSFLPSSSTPFMLHALCAPSGEANSMNPNRVEYEGSLLYTIGEGQSIRQLRCKGRNCGRLRLKEGGVIPSEPNLDDGIA